MGMFNKFHTDSLFTNSPSQMPFVLPRTDLIQFRKQLICLWCRSRSLEESFIEFLNITTFVYLFGIGFVDISLTLSKQLLQLEISDTYHLRADQLEKQTLLGNKMFCVKKKNYLRFLGPDN